MGQDDGKLVDKIQCLTDIELAVLLCLVTEQHCVIEADGAELDRVERELELIASSTFGLTCIFLDCNPSTTLDDFGNGILIDHDGDDYYSISPTEKPNNNHTSTARATEKRPSGNEPELHAGLDHKKIANLVVAKNLNTADNEVQVQALELIRNKRNFTRTAVHAAPKPFIFVALQATGSQRLSTHLNDHLFISHTHLPEDGLPNLYDLETRQGQQHPTGTHTNHNNQEEEEDIHPSASTSSIIKTLLPNSNSNSKSETSSKKPKTHNPIFSPDEIKYLAQLTSEVTMTSEVRAYLHNVVVFMRLHRAVGGGVSALATRHFEVLSRALAPLHSLPYTTPALVALAARKIYTHRIVITPPERERSLQWGSSLEAVKAVLEGVTPRDVVEEVLESVEVPL
ncbi:uncharacterized protein EI97DRAFT_436765 [Westerdykella ornata]|uniref:Magnesium chelatase n=1 Tax=Westerdykella ornata TaxID=318751 RepID=A0A6A6J8I8_WESOR|nr:uncharacterized protein EI97DRAFT_436765 [Westerdykella ornata]KAF2272685.1 hypothetical protein EI97DRAFT_436765 [Westerdykella ornata]